MTWNLHRGQGWCRYESQNRIEGDTGWEDFPIANLRKAIRQHRLYEAVAWPNSQSGGCKTNHVNDQEVRTKRLLWTSPKKSIPKSPITNAKETEEKAINSLRARMSSKAKDYHSSKPTLTLSTKACGMLVFVLVSILYAAVDHRTASQYMVLLLSPRHG